MAERLVRLYGPATISTSASAPTTIFTVPTKKTYVVRLITAVPSVTTATGVQGQLIFGKTNVTTQSNWVAGLSVVGTSNTTLVDPNKLAIACPINESEVLVGFYTDTSGGVRRFDYQASNNASWSTSTTTDATTLTHASFIPNPLITVPNNIYFCVANTKAAAPDTVTSIVDNHDAGATGIASLVTATSGINRASIWGGYLPQVPTVTSTVVATFGGTFTSAYMKAVVLGGGNVFHGTPTTSNVVRQTATATGTTETTCTITTTPIASDGFQLIVLSSNAGVTALGPSGSSEVADGSLATPTNSAFAYVVSPPITNPAITLSGAGTTWAACLIEVGGSGIPAVTISGIIQE